jgi:RNA polymerase sigma-70 factor, ECF subfamily
MRLLGQMGFMEPNRGCLFGGRKSPSDGDIVSNTEPKPVLFLFPRSAATEQNTLRKALGPAARRGAVHGEMANHGNDQFAKDLVGHLPRLRAYAIALTSSVSAADDLVQDCMERALEQAGSLENSKRMGGWLRSILLNLYIDFVRLQRRRGMAIDITKVDNDLELSVPSSDSGAAIDFVRALATLSVEHRQILLLIGLQGLGYREVADELGIPIGTVMSRLARARERLRSALEKEEVVNPALEHPPGRRPER